jgi:hypothetical protein
MKEVQSFIANYCQFFIPATGVHNRNKVNTMLAPDTVVMDASFPEKAIYVHLKSVSFLITVLQDKAVRYKTKQGYRDYGKTIQACLLRMYRARQNDPTAKVWSILFINPHICLWSLCVIVVN